MLTFEADKETRLDDTTSELDSTPRGKVVLAALDEVTISSLKDGEKVSSTLFVNNVEGSTSVVLTAMDEVTISSLGDGEEVCGTLFVNDVNGSISVVLVAIDGMVTSSLKGSDDVSGPPIEAD